MNQRREPTKAALKKLIKAHFEKVVPSPDPVQTKKFETLLMGIDNWWKSGGSKFSANYHEKGISYIDNVIRS